MKQKVGMVVFVNKHIHFWSYVLGVGLAVGGHYRGFNLRSGVDSPILESWRDSSSFNSF
jgi:hypothetical protein